MSDSTLGNREVALNKGMSWLFEHELLGAKSAQEALWLNIYNQSTAIKDVKLVIDQINKKMLIYLELGFFRKYFANRSAIASDTMDVVEQVLPAYQLRVVYDKQIYQKAAQLLEKLDT